MQLPGNPRPLLFLGSDQPVGEQLHFPVAYFQRVLLCADLFLGAMPLASLRQEPRDQKRLENDEREIPTMYQR